MKLTVELKEKSYDIIIDNPNGLENVKKIVGLIDEFRPNITSSSKLSTSRIKPFRKYND